MDLVGVENIWEVLNVCWCVALNFVGELLHGSQISQYLCDWSIALWQRRLDQENSTL